MSARVLGMQDGEDDGVTYDVNAAQESLAVQFYRGDPDAHEKPWRALLHFVRREHTLSGAGPNRRAAFLAAASRHAVAVRGGIPLPAVTWSDVERALDEEGAFRQH